jgi:hypothetical protein
VAACWVMRVLQAPCSCSLPVTYLTTHPTPNMARFVYRKVQALGGMFYMWYPMGGTSYIPPVGSRVATGPGTTSGDAVRTVPKGAPVAKGIPKTGGVASSVQRGGFGIKSGTTSGSGAKAGSALGGGGKGASSAGS